MFNKHDLITHANKIRTEIEDLKINNHEYQENTYAATGSRKRVINRIMTVYNIISKITGTYGGDIEARIFPSNIKEQLFYEGYVCSYCKNTILSLDDAEVDHIIPFSLSGRTDISNAQLLHRTCNREKSNTILVTPSDDEEWDNSEIF
jgi:5-methylcytosine-specific restriction endonuclease McrA